jgi:pentatricopeptide repeat protein
MRNSSLTPNVVTFTTLIKACIAAGAAEQGVRIFHEMEADGIRADVKAYNSLMAAFSRCESWDRSWSVLGSMRRAGISPDIVSYNILLKACERCAERFASSAFCSDPTDARSWDYLVYMT